MKYSSQCVKIKDWVDLNYNKQKIKINLFSYKYGYHSGPEVHHVYLAPPPPPPPPVRYVEYIEKPVFVPKIIEKPVFKPHDEYAPPSWSSQPLPDPVYGYVTYIYRRNTRYFTGTCSGISMKPIFAPPRDRFQGIYIKFENIAFSEFISSAWIYLL